MVVPWRFCQFDYIIVITFCILFGLPDANALSSSEDFVPVRRDRKTRFVAFGARHGIRNPSKFLNDSSSYYGFEGALELTALGKRQAFALGRQVRNFVHGLLSSNYMPAEAVFYTSSASRTQMTLQLALAGLYPPRAFALWNLALDWSPVPYTIDDPMLRMYSVTCPSSNIVWKPINDETLSSIQKIKEDNHALLEYMTENTGWEPTIESAANLADNINLFKLHNASLPAWLVDENVTDSTGSTTAQNFLQFQELPQIECANYAPCRSLMAGVWLLKLADLLDSVSNGTESRPKVVGFVSHTEIVLSAMIDVGIVADHVETTAGFVLEVRDIPEWETRILLHSPIEIDDHVIHKATYSDELRNLTSTGDWIPVEDFVMLLRSKAINNWPLACGLETQDTADVPSETDNLIVEVLEAARSEKVSISTTANDANPVVPSFLFPVIMTIVLSLFC